MLDWTSTLRALAARPLLWPTALRQARTSVRHRWWRHRPFVPVPDREYLRFRLETQYGSGGDLDPDDLLAYLGWCREQRRRIRGRR